MADWITLPVIATNDLIHVDLFQDIWKNLHNLKNLVYSETAFNGPDATNSTSSTTFIDVSTTSARLQFVSFGGDLLAGLMVNVNIGTTRGGGKLRYELDGAAYGNTDGLMNIQNYVAQGFQQAQLLYFFRNIAAGDHILDLQCALNPVTAGPVVFYPLAGRYKFWVVELQ